MNNLVRFALAAVVAVTAVTLVSVDAAHAAVRLTGEYAMIGRTVKGNMNPRGDVAPRRYRFTPLCPNGPCRKVALRREGPHNSHFRSILHRNRRGRYVGVERSRFAGCRQVARLRFWIVDREDGEASAIRGRARFTDSCGFFEIGTLYGERR